MIRYEFLSGIESVNPLIMWFIFITSLMYMYFLLKKERKSYITYFFIYISIGGIFEYLGQTIFRIYEISIILYVFSLVMKHRKINSKFIIGFCLFSILYLIMVFWHKPEALFSDLRQYFIYLFPLFVFIFLYMRVDMINRNDEILKIQQILKVQIFASILKFFLIGMNEKMVGILTISGAGVATFFPVLFFMLCWYLKHGNLQKADWKWVFLSLLVPIVSNKRAVWFFFPATIFIFYFVYNKIKHSKKAIYIVFLIPFIVYFGARINPTLNPEKAVFGSFDLEYIIQYITEYNLGGNKDVNIEYATGRMGGNSFFWEKVKRELFSEEILFGYGNETYNEYGGKDERNISKFGFRSKFMLTGWNEILVRCGLIVLIPFIIIMFSLLSMHTKRKDILLFTIVFLFSFIFYAGVISTNFLLSSIFIFLIVINTQKMKYYQSIKKNKSINKEEKE